MSAVDTGLRVLAWALGERRSPPPAGDLTGLDQLACPPPAVQAAICRLAAVTAARLRVDPGSGTVGPELVLLAAAVGGRRDPLAEQLLAALPHPATPIDSIAYHGIAARVLAAPADAGFDPALLGLVRSLSPLSGLLDHPVASGRMRCETMLDDLLELGPAWRRLLTLTFAAPPASTEQALWRGELLALLRFGEHELVLDVYETALRSYGAQHVALLRAADNAMQRAEDLDAALATAALWGPLEALKRSKPRALRDRRDLGYEYLLALRVVDRARPLLGGDL